MAVEAALDEVLIRFRALKLPRVMALTPRGLPRSRKTARRAANPAATRHEGKEAERSADGRAFASPQWH